MITPLAMLDAEPVWKWGYSCLPFEESMALYLEVVTTLKGLPAYTTKNDKERRAISFMYSSRRHYKAGRLSRVRIQQLEWLPYWTWTPQDDAWYQTLAEIKTFIHQHGRDPSTMNPTEIPLCLKMTRLRQNIRTKRLSKEQLNTCKTIPSLHALPLTERAIRAAKEIKAFVHLNQYFPSSYVKTNPEHRLGLRWVRFKSQKRRGKISTECFRILNSIPGVSWYGNAREARDKRQQALKQKETKHGKNPKRLPSPNQSPKGRS
jgi:hypothetical protein